MHPVYPLISCSLLLQAPFSLSHAMPLFNCSTIIIFADDKSIYDEVQVYWQVLCFVQWNIYLRDTLGLTKILLL